MDCPRNADDVFGPAVATCRREFDFTLFFEQSILVIAPLAVALLGSLTRIAVLYRRTDVAVGGFVSYLKLVSLGLLAGLQLTILTLWRRDDHTKTRASVPAAALSLVATVVLAVLSFFEHRRSLRPSDIIVGYFTYSILADIVQIRTLWLIPDLNILAIVHTTAVALKIPVVILEGLGKRSCLKPEFALCPPESLSGLAGRGFYWWLNPLFRKGFGSTLAVSDLFVVDGAMESKELLKKSRIIHQVTGPESKRSLIRTLVADLKWPLLSVVVPYLCVIGFTMAQPLLIRRTLEWFSAPSGTLHKNYGYGLLGAFFFDFFGLSVSTAIAHSLVARSTAMIRGTLVSVVYQRTTELGVLSVAGSASLTIMSTDVDTICEASRAFHMVWTSFVQLGIALWLLYSEVGPGMAAPLALLLVNFGILAVLGKKVSIAKKAWVGAVEKRVGVTTQVLGVMKSVRLAGLVDTISTVVQGLRVDELRISKSFRFFIVLIVNVSYTAVIFSPFVGFMIYALLARSRGETLDPARAFSALSLFGLVTMPINIIVQKSQDLISGIACSQRLHEFLQGGSRVDYRRHWGHQEALDEKAMNGNEEKIEREDLPEKKSPRTFVEKEPDSDISIEGGIFRWKAGEDPVLKDIHLEIPKGRLSMVIGPVSSGKTSLLHAMLGEIPEVEGVVKISSTEVAYCGQTPWLRNRSIRENILGESNFDRKLYKEVVHCCALEPTFKALTNGDETVIGSKGSALSGGEKQRVALARAVYSQKRVVLLDDVLSGLDADTEKMLFYRLFGPGGLFRRRNTTVVLATHSLHHLSSAQHIVVLGSDGTIADQGDFKKISSSRPDLIERNGQEADELDMAKIESILAPPQPSEDSQLSKETEINRRTGDTTIYKYYADYLGHRNLVLFMSAGVFCVFCMQFPEIWLSWWADANTKHPNQNLGKWIGVYGLFSVGALVGLLVACVVLLIVMLKRSAEGLHQVVLDTVMNANMSFFSKTDTGITTNRFSQDMMLIDMELPVAVLNTFSTFVICIAQLIVLSITTRYLAAVLPVCILVFYLIQKFYLRTSRQLRFLDLETKAPVYSQFIETLSGLATLRAFGWIEVSQNRNNELLDLAQRPYYLLLCAQSWLNLVLDLVVTSIAVLTMGTAIALQGVISAGFVGVALVNVTLFSRTLRQLISSWAELETSLGAISRIKSFEENTLSEHLPTETNEPPPEWPSAGAVQFKSMSASYGEEHGLALEEINLTIKPGERIGVCGSSGSGKSSLVLSIFRMIELAGGSITVDGIDITTLPRNVVRNRLIAVPQEPFLIEGTVRANVDPAAEESDERIIDVLTKVQLWDVIKDKGGLDQLIGECSLSHGQQQLLSLSRSLLRHGNIVVLDEATSSIDIDTEKIIQGVISHQFTGRTIIAVAHRLNTILDFDRIALFSKGKLAELDTPEALMGRDSQFRELYRSWVGEETKQREAEEER